MPVFPKSWVGVCSIPVFTEPLGEDSGWGEQNPRKLADKLAWSPQQRT